MFRRVVALVFQKTAGLRQRRKPGGMVFGYGFPVVENDRENVFIFPKLSVNVQ